MSNRSVAPRNANVHEGVLAGSILAKDAPLSRVKDTDEALRLAAVARLIRSFDDDKKVRMTHQSFAVLMVVAGRPGASMQEIIRISGLSSSSVSRNVMDLSQERRDGETPGLDLIETVQDPLHSQRKLCFLTTKGKSFVREVLNAGKSPVDFTDFDAPSAREWLNRKVHNV